MKKKKTHKITVTVDDEMYEMIKGIKNELTSVPNKNVSFGSFVNVALSVFITMLDNDIDPAAFNAFITAYSNSDKRDLEA